MECDRFFVVNNPKNQKFENMKNKNKIRTATELFLISDHFLPFYLPKNPENQNFEKKIKKTPGDIVLHKCTKNHDHMLYCS